MKKFWISAALTALTMLTSSDFIKNVKAIVKSLINRDLAGEEKRLEAIEFIKSKGFEYSSWLINASIELALGWLKSKYPRLFL